MPSQVALLLCTVFVCFLLRLDRKQSLNVSAAAWVPTIWLFSVSGKPLGIWLGTQGTVETGSQWDQLLLCGLIVLGIVILLRVPLNWNIIVQEQRWALLVFAYMFVSIFWSDILFISFKRWIRECVAFIMALVVVSEPSPRAALEAILRRSAYILIPFSVMLIKYYPDYGTIYSTWEGKQMWVGVALHKNSLARLCIVLAFFLVWVLLRRWREPGRPRVRYETQANIFVLLLTLFILKGPPDAYSTTSIVSLILGLAVFATLHWIKRRRITPNRWLFGAAATALIAYGTITPLVGGRSLGSTTKLLNRDDTLTGRTDIWAKLMPTLMDNAVVGVGFGGFWTTETIEQHGVNECHNGYLEVLLELGVIGLVVMSVFLISCAGKAVVLINEDFDWGCLWLCLIFMALVHNIGESSINAFATPMTALLLFLSAASSPLPAAWRFPHELGVESRLDCPQTTQQ